MVQANELPPGEQWKPIRPLERPEKRDRWRAGPSAVLSQDV